MTELTYRPAVELAAAIRAGELSPLELTEACLRRIERLDARLNAFVTVVADRALDEARSKQEALASGSEELPPFFGVPVPIKDLYDTAGIRTTYSCRRTADHVPEVDAAAVRRLKEAGMIVIGKTNTPEFGQIPMTESDLNGICRNPWDEERTPGGSSGGAACAVAAGMVPVAHASDGGGSIRVPASCCGLFGLKPARGRVSQGPKLGEDWEGFSTQGMITRSVADSAALLDVLAGYEPGDPYWAPEPERPFAAEVGAEPGRLRLGVVRTTTTGVPVEPEVTAALDDALALLAGLGHEVLELDGLAELEEPELTAMFIRVVQATVAMYPAEPADLEPLNRMLAEGGMQTNSIDYVRATIFLHRFARRVAALWQGIDVLVSPTMPMPPPPVGYVRDHDDLFMQLGAAAAIVSFTALANITGQPAMSVPLGRAADGLPIGIQFVGPPAGEALLFRLAAQLEQARPWAGERPPLAI